MGRRPKKPGAVTRLRERTKPSGKPYYYYDAGGKPRKEVPLGSDYGLAIMKYAELERDRNADNLAEKIVTLRYVSAQYFLDVVPKKAPSTQKKDAQYLVKLLEFFDDPPDPESSGPTWAHDRHHDRALHPRSERQKGHADEVIADRIRNCGPKR